MGRVRLGNNGSSSWGRVGSDSWGGNNSGGWGDVARVAGVGGGVSVSSVARVSWVAVGTVSVAWRREREKIELVSGNGELELNTEGVLIFFLFRVNLTETREIDFKKAFDMLEHYFIEKFSILDIIIIIIRYSWTMSYNRAETFSSNTF